MRGPFPASLVALLLFCPVGACGTFGGTSQYPNLRDVPAPPAAMTSAEERERLKGELAREREGGPIQAPSPSKARLPAVPPLPRKDQSMAPEDFDPVEACGEPPGQAARPATPPLRGTLSGAAREVASRLAPSGITAAISAAGGPTEVRFEPVSAVLTPAGQETLGREAALFLTARGGAVTIDARGGPRGRSGSVPSLDRLALGLRRASAIADFLVTQGIGPDRIKLLVTGEDGALGPRAEDLGADSAQVFFERGL